MIIMSLLASYVTPVSKDDLRSARTRDRSLPDFRTMERAETADTAVPRTRDRSLPDFRTMERAETADTAVPQCVSAACAPTYCCY